MNANYTDRFFVNSEPNLDESRLNPIKHATPLITQPGKYKFKEIINKENAKVVILSFRLMKNQASDNCLKVARFN